MNRNKKNWAKTEQPLICPDSDSYLQSTYGDAYQHLELGTDSCAFTHQSHAHVLTKTHSYTSILAWGEHITNKNKQITWLDYSFFIYLVNKI